MANKEEMFLYNDDVNGNKIVLLYNDDDDDEGIESQEVSLSHPLYSKLISPYVNLDACKWCFCPTYT